jgi:hypothetical protein
MPLFMILLLTVLILLIPTAYAAWIGAPYAPTHLPVIRKGFKEIQLGEGDTLIDLGVGDGGILLTAAATGATAVGFELSPIMWAIARLRSLAQKKIHVRYANFFHQKFPEATHIFAFLMPNNMEHVRQYLLSQPLPNLKYILVYAFPFKEITPLTVIREDKCAPLYVYRLEDIKSV